MSADKLTALSSFMGTLVSLYVAGTEHTDVYEKFTWDFIRTCSIGDLEAFKTVFVDEPDFVKKTEDEFLSALQKLDAGEEESGRAAFRAMWRLLNNGKYKELQSRKKKK
jgi:hypothetical protein